MGGFSCLFLSSWLAFPWKTTGRPSRPASSSLTKTFFFPVHDLLTHTAAQHQRCSGAVINNTPVLFTFHVAFRLADAGLLKHVLCSGSVCASLVVNSVTPPGGRSKLKVPGEDVIWSDSVHWEGEAHGSLGHSLPRRLKRYEYDDELQRFHPLITL